MKIHPRQKVVQEASCAINKALNDVCEEYDLTCGEMLSIVSLYLASEAKYMIRQERHGDTDKPGGLE